jgi:hypothetical protein
MEMRPVPSTPEEAPNAFDGPAVESPGQTPLAAAEAGPEADPEADPEAGPEAGPEADPEVGPEAVAVDTRTRVVFGVFVAVFLVLPAVVMLLLLSSGSGLGDLFNTVLSDLGKQLSGVGDRI